MSALGLWALGISIIAIIFTALRDFILPHFLKPELEFDYKEKKPFRRKDIQIVDMSAHVRQIKEDHTHIGTFLRFKIKNVGRRPALNCRTQIKNVLKDGNIFEDYTGFPLRWASKPEAKERLNIGIGETEFIDLLATSNKEKGMKLQKHHNLPIGIFETIPPGKYTLEVLVSGDNFKPYLLSFLVNKKDSLDYNDISLKYNGLKKEKFTFIRKGWNKVF